MRKTLVTMLTVLIGLMPLQAASKSVGNTTRNVAKLSAQESKTERTVIFEDGFESYTAFATEFTPWMMFDGDVGASYSITNVTFPNQGYTGSFIIWTPSGATPAQTDPAWLPHAGSKSATCFNAVTASAPNNDWLISPPITLQTASQLKFWAESVTTQYGPEKIKVGISTGGTAVSDFTIISGATAISVPDAWTEYSYDLAAYDGQSVRIAIQCVSNDAFALQIDDFSVTGGASTDTQAPTVTTPTGTSAASGTAMDISTLVTDATGIASVVGKYKLVGQNTWSDFAMTASKATGTYTGTIPSQSAAIAGKVKFATTDTASPANTGESAEFDIAWTAASPDEMWVTWGEDFGTSGVGVASAPWQAATDYDFGPNSQYELKKIVMKGFNNTNPAAQDFSWTVRNATQADANTLELGTALTGLQGTVNSVPGEEVIQDVTVNTKLIGHIALILDMPAAYNIITSNNVPSTNDNHTYVGVAADSLQLLKMLAPTLNHRAWYIKMLVKKPVGIEEIQILPGKSELSQNYPNPFNPTTTISFFNNMTGNVKLSVMNAKGETVATLVNNSVVAGNHKIDFDGSTFNSGVYFYKLETPTATFTKKMLLVK